MDKIKYDFNNRTAVITGGAQGFGLDIAQRFLKSGAKVIIWDIDPKLIDEAKKETNNSNLSSSIVDVSNYQEVESEVSKITQKSKIDILINNAGIAHVGARQKRVHRDLLRVCLGDEVRLRARRPQGESSPAREREPDSSRSARSRRPGTGASNHGFLGSIRNGRVLGRRTRRPRRCHELGTGPYGRALNPCGVHRAPRRVFRGNPSSRPAARRRTALTPPHLFPPRSIHRCSSAPPPPRRSHQ